MAWEMNENGTVRLLRVKESETALLEGTVIALRLVLWGATENDPTTAIQAAMSVEEALGFAQAILKATDAALKPPSSRAH